MISITDSITLDEDELEFSFIRASGPGGQNVNKVSSAVQMRFDARRSSSLSNDVSIRLQKLAGSRLTLDGVIVITANRFRTQERRTPPSALSSSSPRRLSPRSSAARPSRPRPPRSAGSRARRAGRA